MLWMDQTIRREHIYSINSAEQLKAVAHSAVFPPIYPEGTAANTAYSEDSQELDSFLQLLNLRCLSDLLFDRSKPDSMRSQPQRELNNIQDGKNTYRETSENKLQQSSERELRRNTAKQSVPASSRDTGWRATRKERMSNTCIHSCYFTHPKLLVCVFRVRGDFA